MVDVFFWEESRGERRGDSFFCCGHICRHANGVLRLWLGYEGSLESLQWAARFLVYMGTFIQACKRLAALVLSFFFFKYVACSLSRLKQD